MFASHQPVIGAYGRDNPDNMAEVLTFVLMTIQQALHTVPQAMASVRKEGEKSRFLWGFKTSAWNEIQKSKALIYEHSMNLYYGHANPEHAERELLYFFSHIEGMGLAKGGFAVQLLFGLSGCLDSHNIARLGYDPREFKASRYKAVKDARRKAQFLDVYIDLCNIAGGTETLWNEWCNYVHVKHPIFYRSGEHVSELHLKSLNLGG